MAFLVRSDILAFLARSDTLVFLVRCYDKTVSAFLRIPQLYIPWQRIPWSHILDARLLIPGYINLQISV
jgi:hypothetical protein